MHPLYILNEHIPGFMHISICNQVKDDYGIHHGRNRCRKIRKAQRAQGPAAILAIGTATPSNCVYQADYPDYYFRITKSEHMVHLKEKFQRMCDKSMIRKRYMHITEEFLKENPNMCAYMAPSLDARQDLVVVEVPKLGKEAAIKAIKEWGFPKSKITHLVFCTTSGVDMPGADYQLTKLLGLRPSVKRYMMYPQGCFAGGTVLRLRRTWLRTIRTLVSLLFALRSLLSPFVAPVSLT
ncbi:hypothetical protein R6Q59_003470 [Mikania micrantha]